MKNSCKTTSSFRPRQTSPSTRCLTIGAVTQTVEVTTNVGQVEFNTSTMSDTVQQSFLKDLPVLARNPFTLALLDAGVINEYWDEAHRLPFYMWSDGGLDIGGPTGGKNEQIIDGFRTDMAARGSYNASMDSVQEVVVQQQIPDAEHGWSGGGAVNISMKSGTNDIHGDAYGMWRQPNFNALANRVTRSAGYREAEHLWLHGRQPDPEEQALQLLLVREMVCHAAPDGGRDRTDFGGAGG